ncbi:MAG: amidophosphoribosyltransferase [Armatimonadetes bacterium]|nr:amidophosphoribosyltransferase [Armatimonadota bacterium]
MSDAWHDDRIKEECGVVGLYAPGGDSARLVFFSLFALQHRGQESAGIAASDGEKVRMHKSMGLVSQVFNEEILGSLPGDFAIGHTRYSTMGSSVLRNAQPIYCTSSVGEIAVAHNGNLINAEEVRNQLEASGEKLETTADSELIALLLVKNLEYGPEEAVRRTMGEIQGAYSVVVLTPRLIMGFRDPYGIRPLVAGRLKGGGHILASESCAFPPINATAEKEIEPGELVIIDEEGMRFSQVVPTERPAMCLFEFIYFARPDSNIYGKSIYAVRERMGEALAREHPADADIVVPVPDSGIPAAIGYSRVSGLPFQEGMMKSRYIHRTFIQPDQRMREMGVRMKLSPLVDKIKGQRIVLVDDSIVRATTTKQIVKFLFECGAKEVHVRITAPPIRFPCFYGIDMASKGELAAAKWSVDEICEHIGATSLGYLPIDSVTEAVGRGNGEFCLACFNGDYSIPVPQNLSKLAFEKAADVGEIGVVTAGQLKLPETE